MNLGNAMKIVFPFWMVLFTLDNAWLFLFLKIK